MLLSDEEHFTIILSAIQDYESGKDICILIVEKIVTQIINCVNNQFTTQDVFDEIVEVFDFYNEFIKAKNVDIKPIPEEIKDLVEIYMNEVVNDVGKIQK